MIKKILKSRTMLFAIALSVLGALQASMNVFEAVLSPQVYGLFTVAVGVAVAVLRVITTTPIDSK